MKDSHHHQVKQYWRPIAGLLILAAIAAGCWFTVVKAQNWMAVKKAAQKQAAARAEEEAKNRMFLEIEKEVSSLSENAGAPEYFKIGQKYLREKKYDRAAAAFELACQKDPVWREPPTFLGYAYLKLGKPQKAQLALQRAIEVDPIYGLAHYLLGQSYFQLKRNDLAQEEFAKAEDFGYASADQR